MPAIGEKPVSSRAISPAESLRARFRDVRDFSKLLTRDLEAEDCVVQSMPDVSPTKWHLAHTTWFFETFVLKKFVTGYRAGDPGICVICLILITTPPARCIGATCAV